METREEYGKSPEPEPPQPSAPPPGPPKEKSLRLPSGAQARIVQPVTGRHQRHAVRMADGDQSSIGYGLIAATVTVDGRALTLEDVLDMELRDVQAIQLGLLGNGESSAPATS